MFSLLMKVMLDGSDGSTFNATTVISFALDLAKCESLA
jgi:hypothetical protein